VAVLPSVEASNKAELEDQAAYPPLATSTPKVAAIVVNNKKPKAKKKSQKEAFLLQDDLNKPLPKLHLASNNNIDDHGDADVSEEEDDHCGSPPVLEPMTTLIQSEQKNNITVKIKRPSSPDTAKAASVTASEDAAPRSPKLPKKSKKEKKAKKAKKERHREGDHHYHHHHKKHHKKTIVHVNDDSKAPADCIDLTNKTGIAAEAAIGGSSHQLGLKPDRPEDPQPPPRPLLPPSALHTHRRPAERPLTLSARPSCAGPELCVIKETDLVDGLRVLVKLEGHFHPGKIQAISPPDIYGVLVDKERGNKPHIFSREEVLREAIFEVKATAMKNLPIGTRVCAYWSQKYHHLYPGSISDMDVDRKIDAKYYVNIELDDGDNRDIHVDSIRFLPPNYPLVVYDPDPLMSTMRNRKRRQSWESGTSEGSRANKTPRVSIDSEISPPPSMVASMPQKNHVHAGDLKMRIHVGNGSKQRKSSGGNGYTTAAGNNANGGAHFATSKSGRKASLAQRPSISSSSDSEDGKGGIASFLPKDQVWKWADKGQRRSKGRVYHRIIERKEDKLDIGDSAVFLSTNCPDQPYIGRLESMWETASGTKNVGVRWYYHLAEVECSVASDRQKMGRIRRPKGALFESNHYDENDVQTISHRADVLPFERFVEAKQIDHDLDDDESNDKYYLAGTHNAIEKTVQFAPGVLKCDE